VGHITHEGHEMCIKTSVRRPEWKRPLSGDLGIGGKIISE